MSLFPEVKMQGSSNEVKYKLRSRQVLLVPFAHATLLEKFVSEIRMCYNGRNVYVEEQRRKWFAWRRRVDEAEKGHLLALRVRWKGEHGDVVEVAMLQGLLYNIMKTDVSFNAHYRLEVPPGQEVWWFFTSLQYSNLHKTAHALLDAVLSQETVAEAAVQVGMDYLCQGTFLAGPPIELTDMSSRHRTVKGQDCHRISV
jgi:hypothetical protein